MAYFAFLESAQSLGLEVRAATATARAGWPRRRAPQAAPFGLGRMPREARVQARRRTAAAAVPARGEHRSGDRRRRGMHEPDLRS